MSYYKNVINPYMYFPFPTTSTYNLGFINSLNNRINVIKQNIDTKIRSYCQSKNINSGSIKNGIYYNILYNMPHITGISNSDMINEISIHLNKQNIDDDYLFHEIKDFVIIDDDIINIDWSILNGIEHIIIKNISEVIYNKIKNNKKPVKTIPSTKSKPLVQNTPPVNQSISCDNNYKQLANALNTLEHEIAVLKVDIKKCMDVDTRYNYLQNQIDDINLLLSELIENETKNYINFDNNDKNIINSTMNNEIDDENENETENEVDLVIENVENIGESVADEISKILH
jgi:hypothetical protein